MPSFIKENTALVVALLLPVVFACFFYFSKNITQEHVLPPMHDLVVTDSRNHQNFEMEVIDGALVIKFIYPTYDDRGNIRGNTNKPNLYYIDAETLIAEPLSFVLPDDARNPPEDKEGQAVDIEIAKVKGLQFKAGDISPDGFTFEQMSRSDGNIMTEIYSERSYNRNHWALKKDRASFKVKGIENYYFQVLGWVSE